MLTHYRLPDLPISLSSFIPERGKLGVCYCHAESRNQWLKWDGETSVVDTYAGASLSLDEEKKRCESYRKPGSKFVIKELPLFVYANAEHTFCFTSNDLFNYARGQDFLDVLCAYRNLSDALHAIANKFNVQTWLGSDVNFSTVAPWELEQLLIRTSAPGKKDCSMVWCCSFVQLNKHQYHEVLGNLLREDDSLR